MRTSVVESVWNGVDDYNDTIINWSYDSLNRLTGEDYNAPDDVNDFNNVYVYNLIGNRLQKLVEGGDDTTYTYDPNNDELASEITDGNSTTYSYDDNGGLLQAIRDDEPNSYYTYNYQGRMASAGDGTTTANYTYNPDGIRVKAVVGATTNKYLVDPFNHTGYAQTLKTENSSTSDKVFYAIGHDIISQATNTSDPNYFVYDGHGSVRHLANSSGTIVESYNYDAYGNAHGFTPGNASTNLLYAGEWHDSTAQQYYLRARWYSPATGRFNRTDPFAGNSQDPQSLHKYNYVHCNPTMNVDPTGKFSLVSMSVNFAISSALMSIAMPVIAPLAAKAATLLIPKKVRESIMRIIPSAFMGGGSASAMGGLGKYTLGFGLGITGGLELLSSPITGKAALYSYWGGILGWQGGAGASVSASLYGGVVYGPVTSQDYTDYFTGVHVAFGQLLSSLARKIRNDIASLMSRSLVIVDPEGIFDAEALAAANQTLSKAANNAAKILDPRFNGIVNLCWGRGKGGQLVVGFSGGASGTLGKSAKYVTLTRTYYTQVLPSGNKGQPFR